MFGGLDDLLFYAMTEFLRLQRGQIFTWLAVSLVLASLLCGLSFLIGRGIHIDWKPGWVLATLIALATPLSLILILLFPTAEYLKPAVAKILQVWQEQFQQDAAWNQETFGQQYWAVRNLNKPDGAPVEDFTEYPPPEDGGNFIPANQPLSFETLAEIDSARVAQHFDHHYALLAKLLWTSERPWPEILKRDMGSYFQKNPGSTYNHEWGVKLAAQEMLGILEKKIGRIILLMRATLISILVILWLPLYAWGARDAWEKLEPITV